MLKRILHAANQVVVHPETHTGTRVLTTPNTVNDAVDMLAVKGDSWQLVQEAGNNIMNCADNVSPLFTAGEGSLTGSAWATELFDNEWVLKNLKPSTTYYGKMTITMNEVVEGKKVYDLAKGILLHRGAQSVAGAWSAHLLNGKSVSMENGVSLYTSTIFTTPDDLTDLNALVYTERYTDEDGTGAYYSNVTFSNIMLSEVDAPYEPFQPAMPSPEYPSEIVSVEGEMRGSGWNLFYIPDIDINTIERSIKCEISKPITVSMINDNVELYKVIWRLRFSYKDGMLLYVMDEDTKQPKTFFASEENPIMKITLRSTHILSGKYRNIQIEYGTTPRPYDRHRGNSITLPTLRSLPDGTRDVLHVDRAEKRAWVERCVGVVEFDGSKDENWKVDANNGFCISVSDMKNGKLLGGYCNRFQSNNGFLMQCIIFGYNNSYLFFPNTFDIADTLETWKVWLSSNPVTVHYVLATPAIEELEYSEYLLETAQYETNLTVDCDEHLEPEIEVECKVLGR